MLSCFYYWICETDLLYVSYTVFTNILTYVKTPIPTLCYSSTYTQDTLANYVP